MKTNELFDSDAFKVIHYGIDRGTLFNEDAFLIVNKRTNLHSFLTGDSATSFHMLIKTWQIDTPTQDAVEDALDSYTQLGALPLYMH